MVFPKNKGHEDQGFPTPHAFTAKINIKFFDLIVNSISCLA